MTRFDLDVSGGFQPLLAVVAAHGFTDLNSLDCLPHYAFWTCLPLPSPLVTALFCVFSILHFEPDFGIHISTGVHAAVALVAFYKNLDAAFKTMLVYLGFVHTPRHYQRHLEQGNWRGLAIAGAATLFALFYSKTLETLEFGDVFQRIVLAHVSHELVTTS